MRFGFKGFSRWEAAEPAVEAAVPTGLWAGIDQLELAGCHPQQISLSTELLTGRGRFLRCGRIGLDHLGNLQHSLVDLLQGQALLLGCLVDIPHQIRHLRDATTMVCRASAVLWAISRPSFTLAMELSIISVVLGRLGTAGRQIAHFLSHHSKALAMLPAWLLPPPHSSARILVWNAISSMTLIIFDIFVEEALISSIACSME